MKLTGNLKKQAEGATGKWEARSLKAGMKLADDELDNVSGGVGGSDTRPCRYCRKAIPKDKFDAHLESCSQNPKNKSPEPGSCR